MPESVKPIQQVTVLVDYENMNRRARSLFGGSTPQDLCPRGMADTVVARRNNKGLTCELVKVIVFRGRPAQGQPGHTRFCTQDEAWRKDPLIETRYIDLVYSRGTVREKGVDVALALAAATISASGTIDVLVIASEDSDLGPAVSHAKSNGVRVETVIWDNLQGSANGAQKRAWEQQIYAHRLGIDEYRACSSAGTAPVPVPRLFLPNPLPLLYWKVRDAIPEEIAGLEVALAALGKIHGAETAWTICTKLIDSLVGPNRAAGAGRRALWELPSLLEITDPDEELLTSSEAMLTVRAVWRAALKLAPETGDDRAAA
ncbi:NYN domain-containing protein [Arthrobacter liuii]|uniref:NYN domain-containing protein n=1 Tax=Arthrobacter liuii TaxID=1476996 RepID=A0ABQ2AXL0_9MICC|nr:NYN domain-containing protein [Arthrobacter liuii]GGI01308.1 hypothetical protein GCM10007170_40450 [Arthrobacter liuii]